MPTQNQGLARGARSSGVERGNGAAPETMGITVWMRAY
jgi:hypothetical protein